MYADYPELLNNYDWTADADILRMYLKCIWNVFEDEKKWRFHGSETFKKINKPFKSRCFHWMSLHLIFEEQRHAKLLYEMFLKDVVIGLKNRCLANMPTIFARIEKCLFVFENTTLLTSR